MNKKEEILKKNLYEYSKNIANYGNILNNVLLNIDRLIELESQINNNLQIINSIDSKVRPLEFIRQLSSLPTINNEIIKKVKSYIK